MLSLEEVLRRDVAGPVGGDISSLDDNFDVLYMQAELTNHEFLRDLAKDYLAGAPASATGKQTQQLATLALFAFHEHVALCKRIHGEVMA